MKILIKPTSMLVGFIQVQAPPITDTHQQTSSRVHAAFTSLENEHVVRCKLRLPYIATKLPPIININ